MFAHTLGSDYYRVSYAEMGAWTTQHNDLKDIMALVDLK